MKLSDIIACIEKTAPPAFAASWDNSGVQVASLREEADSLAVVLDPTLENLRRAADTGAECILAHHPLLMRPRYPNRPDAYLSALALLLSRNICLYSAHTSLDANPEGPARWLAQELDLRSVDILEPQVLPGPGETVSGFGFVGLLPEAMAYERFCGRLAGILGKSAWQACGPRPERVSRIACCPGSGGSLLEAAAAKADLFITGDIKYHTALEAAAAGLPVLDVGHFVLEEEMMRRFALALADALPLPVRFVPGVDPISAHAPAVV